MSSELASVHVLYDGYSYLDASWMRANCSCVLIKGHTNVIVDTMTAWDKDKVITGLSLHGLCPSDISYAIGTHGHCDHTGNLNLFTQAKQHIVGYTVCQRDNFYIHPFECGEPFKVCDGVELLPTPGHTKEHVSVVVTTASGTVVVAGDLFEKEQDIFESSIWREAGTEDETLQRTNRLKVAEMADFIIPGHGARFKVTEEHRKALREQAPPGALS